MIFIYTRAQQLGNVLKKDAVWIFLIVSFALLTRAPGLGYPSETVFDETIYMNYIIRTVTERPFFDIHPPLARMIFAAIADNAEFSLWASPIETRRTFADFPFLQLRLFSLTLGVLLPVLLFFGARLTGLSPPLAALGASLVVFDNALIVYARTFLPDTLLIVLNMLAFFAALAALQTGRRGMRVALIMVAGIAIGGAIAIKWTALGIWLTIFFACLLYRRWADFFAMTALAAVCYLLIFIISFTGFTKGGKVDPIFLYYPPSVGELVYPDGNNFMDILTFLPRIHSEMLAANRSDGLIEHTLRVPSPIAWPIANSVIIYWISGDGSAKIQLAGNAFVWSLACFMFLFELSRLLAGWFREHRLVLSRVEAILIAGYAANYLPFFLIDRPMFLYHYFTSLLFLFLLFPHIAPRFSRCIAAVAGGTTGARALLLLFFFLGTVNFLLLLPGTYGW